MHLDILRIIGRVGMLLNLYPRGDNMDWNTIIASAISVALAIVLVVKNREWIQVIDVLEAVNSILEDDKVNPSEVKLVALRLKMLSKKKGD